MLIPQPGKLPRKHEMHSLTSADPTQFHVGAVAGDLEYQPLDVRCLELVLFPEVDKVLLRMIGS